MALKSFELKKACAMPMQTCWRGYFYDFTNYYWGKNISYIIKNIVANSIDARRCNTIDTELKAKRDNIISELITFRSTKAKAKENSGGGGEVELNWLSCKNTDRN